MKRFAKIKNAFLLGYLALFLNLGPSLHRAPIFGLHNHSDDSPATHDSCCCDCNRFSEAEDGQNQEQDSDRRRLETQPCDDCALCRFFHRYHSTPQIEADFLIQRIVKLDVLPFSLQYNATTILSTARGPPTV